MVGELFMYTGVSTAAHIVPVYKIRKALAKLIAIPVAGVIIGGVFALGYSFGISWLVTNIFHFQSSVAGLANLLSALIFSAWLYFEGRKIKTAQ
jgi:hypothetical protein